MEKDYDNNTELQNDNSSIKEDFKNKYFNNIQSSLNLKEFEFNIFQYFTSLNKYIDSYHSLDILFIIIESLQFLCIFNSKEYFPEQTYIFEKISSYINFKEILKPYISLIIFGSLTIMTYSLMIAYSTLNFFKCSNDGDSTDSEYTCFNKYHNIIITISLVLLLLYETFCYIGTYTAQYYIPLSKNIKSIISNKTLVTYRIVVLLEVANTMIFKVYFNNRYLSSIIMFLGFAYLLYIHLSYQSYYSQKLNNFYSSIWFSLTLQSFIYIFFSIFKIKLIYPIFLGIGGLGLICGWFLNKFYYHFYSKRIFNNITKKYNQQHIMNRLKEEIEFDKVNEDESLSIETIVTSKNVIRKEKVYKKSSDCSYISKFIEFNRSLESFNLVYNLFKEGIIQYERDPEIYIQYWNHLHGIKNFMLLNKCCFFREEDGELLNKIDLLSEKLIKKSIGLSKSIFMKYLIYNATSVYKMDQLLLNSNDKNIKISSSIMEVNNIKNRALQYYVISLNYLKNIMDSLRIMENKHDIKHIMIINDELTEILTKGEMEFQKYLFTTRFSKDSLALSIIFYRNAMNREDMEEKYIELLEESENSNEKYIDDDDESKYNNIFDRGYAKSEALSSSINSENKSKKSRILKRNMLHKSQKPLYKLLNNIQILTTLVIIIGSVGIYFYMDCFSTIHNNIYLYVVSSRSPSCGSNVKKNMRLLSLQAASGENPYGGEFYNVLDNERYFIDQVYIANIYKVQFTSTYGEYTFHPLNSEVIDLPKDINYFKTLEKMLRKIDIVLGQANETSILTPDYLNDNHIRYFNLNTRERFGVPFIRSLVLRNQFLQNMLIKHQNTFFYILGGISIFMLYIITIVIIPNSNANFKFINHIISLYKTLPSNYFNDKSIEYYNKIQEINNNYDIQDEGNNNTKDKKRNISSTIKVKYSFLVYCLIVTLSLIIPLLTVFNMRSYRLASINLYIIEHILQDGNYYGIGEPLSLINENFEILQTLETDLKSGVYGGPFSLFDTINNPGCYRSTYLQHECDQIKYNQYYTEALSNSSTDFMMVEYINRVNEFLTNIPEKHYDLKNVTEIKEAYDYIMNDPYIQAIKYLSYDIIGHIDAMNELGTEYIRNLIETYEYVTLIGHIIGSLIIFITFFFFISKPIKKQLRVIDVLINITFSIPSNIYDLSPNMKE
ncbi:hypothetical protein BCR32DRAFT_282151 [Anaeromyces robustus]|uniref:Uncharacterized protein n=1 Tax=Anaeromyces robustus TaxID=1754192 RepID=A0A1Y1WYT8_9FUNG|nr:hypothetical protein BCR32DRAFT_282151 [Anaeromyces robustus]|eukprot:ORX78592.1 hypothetical protein BCR32DRAFT_282151 [Anaeromyces robustus]